MRYRIYLKKEKMEKYCWDIETFSESNNIL